MIRSQTGTILWKHGRRLKGSRLLADPFSRPNLIVLDTLGKLNAHGHGVDGLLPRVPASVQRVDHRSDRRARRAYSPVVGMKPLPCPVCGGLTIAAPSKGG